MLLGYQVSGLCEELAKYGADKIITVDDKALEVYTTEPYTHAMAQVIEHYKPAIVLYGATAIGRDLAPRVSARVHTGLTADCTKLEIAEDTKEFRMTRPAFGGKHHRNHRLPGIPSADGNRPSGCYAEGKGE